MLDVGDDGGTRRGNKGRALVRCLLEALQVSPGADVCPQRHGNDVPHTQVAQGAKHGTIAQWVSRGEGWLHEHAYGLPRAQVVKEGLRVVYVVARAMAAHVHTGPAHDAPLGIDVDQRRIRSTPGDACPKRAADAHALVASNAVVGGVDKTFAHEHLLSRL